MILPSYEYLLTNPSINSLPSNKQCIQFTTNSWDVINRRFCNNIHTYPDYTWQTSYMVFMRHGTSYSSN